MKTFFLIFLLALSSPLALYSQTNDSVREIEDSVITIDHREIETNPLYIIKIADKTMNHRLDDVTLEESFLKELTPGWFESVNVLKGPDGVKKYGSLAQDGVIVISLKKDSWEKMTPELQNRFK